MSGEIASSERFNISRTAYREAIKILAAKGLVAPKTKVGTKVNPKESWNLLDPNVLSWTFEEESDLGLLYSLFELRNAIESAAAALAATRRTEEHLQAMRAAINRMARFTLATEAGRQADQEFHAALLQASGNLYMISLTSGVNAVVNATTMFKQWASPLSRDPAPDHLRVLEAIAAGDPTRAQRRMTELITLALQDMPLRSPLFPPHKRRRPTWFCSMRGQW